MLSRAALAGLAMVLVACGPAPASSSPSSPLSTPDGSTAASAMVTWLQDHTLACAGPADAANGNTQWTCEKDQGEAQGSDRTVYRVVFIVGPNGLVEINAAVDQTKNEDLDIQKTQGFLADTIGAAPPIGAVGALIGPWVDEHIEAGASASFNGVQANLSPFGRVTQLRLAVQG